MGRRILSSLVVASLTVGLLGGADPARADHTDPGEPLAPTDPGPTPTLLTRGQGTWELIRNFPAPSPADRGGLVGGGTDLDLFRRRGDIYVSAGSLGQSPEAVGQRIIHLTDRGVVNPQWVADHGSANCEVATGVTGLQHDAAVAAGRLLIDTTDASGRCHDPGGGGLELIDISGIGRPAFESREVHLTRHQGTTHTVTVDATRPWVVYSSSSEFSAANWIDVLDIRSCLRRPRASLEMKRARCRPLVYRVQFEPAWTQARDVHFPDEPSGASATCHDITARPGRVYCAALNATLILDVSDLTDPATGDIRGRPLDCPVIPGTRTDAMVTNCANPPYDPDQGLGTATGWAFLGTFNHPGRDCVFPHPQGSPVVTCNGNNFVPADEGISVSHEADPSHDDRFMFVTDERGGGVVPPGASCSTLHDNEIGNGGIHAFDISDPTDIRYALTPDGEPAVYRSEPVVDAASFCDVHVIEHVPGQQRIIAAYYTQGTKIVDYHVDANGRLRFEEVASLTLRGSSNANTWTSEVFSVIDNRDGTQTLFIVASDIERGIDVVSWTGPPGPRAGTIEPATAHQGARAHRAMFVPQ